jgi:hypothetical protein
MHYLISKLVTQQIEIKNYNRFIFGSLSPDISSHSDGSYGIAHFSGFNKEMNIKGIDWLSFCNKYEQQILSDDLVLGYLVHLISDAYWLKNIQNKFVRKFPEIKNSLILKGYEDMLIYNGILTEKFKLYNDIIPESNITVSEIVKLQIEPYFTAFNNDFLYDYKGCAAFKIYPYDDVMLFIKNAVLLSVKEINAIRYNTARSNPENYYVEITFADDLKLK